MEPNDEMGNAKIYTNMDDVMAEAQKQTLSLGYQEFHEGLKKEKAHSIVDDTFRQINNPEWPLPYYQMRDSIWPLYFGKTGAYFLTTCILNGVPPLDLGMSDEDNVLLQKWYILYRAFARRAERFSANPTGFDDFYTVFDSIGKSYIIRPFRNDGSHINISVTVGNIEFMLHRLIDILSEAEAVFQTEIDRAKLIQHIETNHDK